MNILREVRINWPNSVEKLTSWTGLFQWRTRWDWLGAKRKSGDWKSFTMLHGALSAMTISTLQQQKSLVSALDSGSLLWFPLCVHFRACAVCAATETLCCLVCLSFCAVRSVFLSASLYVSKRGAYWDRLCRDVVGRWLSRACTVAKRCILGL